jgi:hypothetical protein
MLLLLLLLFILVVSGEDLTLVAERDIQLLGKCVVDKDC